MKVTYNWLKEYVDFDWSPEELAERLTMLGVEVEGVETCAGAFEGIVVGQVIVKEQHPNADRLTLCKVNDGEEERQIVCGATNFEVGDKVALALPGTSMPVEEGEKPFVLKAGKIRGEKSEGMMCSGRELRLSDDHEGILILEENAVVGQSFGEHRGLGGGDTVYDLEVTPNRPDLNGVIGLAREIAALTGNALRKPDVKLAESDDAVENLVDVRIEDAGLCPRYNARVIREVKIGPSPDWLRERLERVGLRPINNVVDATNFVMMETGQPLHAFDLRLLDAAGGKPTVVIRRAANGEKFTTLDEQEHELTAENLLIADEGKGIALAGVMGGLNTEIQPDTQDVLLECAYFNPTNIRATSKATRLHTDASYRFERGADIGITDWASQRAAQLILETAGGELAAGAVDAFPEKPESREVTLRHDKVNALLGIELSPEQNTAYLEGLEISHAGDGVFRIPSWRVDLKRETDLIEEVCRLHGVDRIPATPPRGALGDNSFDTVHDELAEARAILTGLGLNEAQGQTLISGESARLTTPEAIALEHPLSSDMDVLRASLLPGLLDSLRNNVTRRNDDVGLFEIGRVFKPGEGEHRRLAILMTGLVEPAFWGDRDGQKVSMADLTGVLEGFLERFGVFGVGVERRSDATDFFLESAELRLGKQEIGELGQLQPALGRGCECRQPVFLAELDMDLLLQRRTRTKSFKALPQFPSIVRDVAMVVHESTTHAKVLGVVKKAKPDNLVDLRLFDVFRGGNVPAGQKSVAYTFTYRHGEKTLTDEEVNGAHEELVETLREQLSAVIRDT